MLMARKEMFQVFVKEMWVAFDRTTINGYYRLANIEDDQNQALLESDETN